MPAKNEEKYIYDAIYPFLYTDRINYELIIVDDNSTDQTISIIKKNIHKNSNIKIYENKGKGKVEALNYGYSLCSGYLIKCIDADDIIANKFFSSLPLMRGKEAHCHDALLCDEHSNNFSVYTINNKIIHESYNHVLKNIISPPRWTWTMTRKLAEKIFPMPVSLPFEDVWFSLTIKKYAEIIHYTKKPLYFYRQHDNQTYGGIFRFDQSIIQFRSKRMLNLINVLEREAYNFFKIDDCTFEKEKIKQTLLSQNRLKIVDVIKAPVDLNTKLKILLMKKAPRLAKYASLLRWKLSSIKQKFNNQVNDS